jgi:hypothetical protein
MSTSNPTKLIVCKPLGDGYRLVAEIGPGNDITVTCWKNSQSRPVPVPARMMPSINAFAVALRRAVEAS